MRRTLFVAGLVGLLAACGGDDAIEFSFDTGLEDTSTDTGSTDIGGGDTGGGEDVVEDTGGGEDVVEDTSEDADGGDVSADVVEDVGGDAADVGGDAVEDTGSDVLEDVGGDVGDDVDGDASDAGDDAGEDVVEDVAPDVIVDELCGNGELDEGEECDDGNDDNTDECTNACRIALCGDGILNSTIGSLEYTSPSVEDPFGATGYICDDGSSCPGGTCEVYEDGFAPEHGICQELGMERAVEVTWEGGPGAGPSPLHADHWDCIEYRCIGNEGRSTGSCETWEMLTSIVCEGIVGEECDDGADNADAADACRTDCTLPFCGDGIVDSDEECDDANRVTDDGCSNTCLLPQCGDGVRNGDEDCDDGNDDDFDACRNSCVFPTCGDGVVSDYDTIEECDEGEDNSLAPDATCRPDCLEQRCGDGVTDTGEECDDGNLVDNDACSNACTLPVCGDGIRQGDEACDDGNDDDTDGCMTDCTLPVCGDGIVQVAESGGGSCAPLILFDTGAPPAPFMTLLAENGIEADVRTTDSGRAPYDLDVLRPYSMVIFYNYNRAISDAEQATLTSYVEGGGTLLVTGYDSLGSPTDTRLASVLQMTTGGDGPFTGSCAVTEAGHPITSGAFGTYTSGTAFTVGSTDHDRAIAGPTVTTIATVGGSNVKISYAEGIGAGGGVAMYWNSNSGLRDWTTAGITQNMFLNLMDGFCGAYAEECDEGEANSDAPDATCRTDCTLQRCGDGVTDTGEDCDDGNDDDTDTCTSLCTAPFCGDGVIQAALGEECDDADANSDDDPDACRTDCLSAYCGDGTVDSDEECDDGNFIDDDGCNTLCELPGCGDGVVQPELGEECDDGNESDRDECTNRCEFGACGDGFVQAVLGEECDDGNDIDDDTCTNACLYGPGYVPYNFYGMPYDYFAFDAAAANILRRTAEFEFPGEPVIAVVSECADTSGGTSGGAPGGPYMGEYNATIGAFRVAGVPEDRVFGLADVTAAEARFDDWDVIVFPEFERCSPSSATWGPLLRTAMESGKRVIVTFPSANSTRFINGWGFIGTTGSGGATTPYRAEEHPFWDGLTMSGYHSATASWTVTADDFEVLARDNSGRILIFRLSPTF